MKITNNEGLPAIFVKAVTPRPEDDPRPNKHWDIRVSQLVDPPQILQLMRRHWDEIVVDAADRLFALDGQSVHAILEMAAAGENALQEERLVIKALGWRVAGKPDLYEEDGTLWDYKKTSIWAFLLGPKREWMQQLNLYRVLLEQNGFPVKQAKVAAFIKDWDRYEARRRDDYPNAPSKTQPIKLWPLATGLMFLHDRVELHQKHAADESLWECSDEERWLRDEQWAVMAGEAPAKPTARAIAVFGPNSNRKGGAPEAEQYRANMSADNPKKSYHVVHRPGKNVRCEEYCYAAPFCAQFARIQREQGASNGARTQQVSLEEAMTILEEAPA